MSHVSGEIFIRDNNNAPTFRCRGHSARTNCIREWPSLGAQLTVSGRMDERACAHCGEIISANAAATSMRATAICNGTDLNQ